MPGSFAIKWNIYHLHHQNSGERRLRPCTYSKKAGLSRQISCFQKIAEPNTNQTVFLLCVKLTHSRSDKAMLVGSSQERGGDGGVWLRVKPWRSSRCSTDA
jgi:hypothetical protein